MNLNILFYFLNILIYYNKYKICKKLQSINYNNEKYMIILFQFFTNFNFKLIYVSIIEIQFYYYF